MQRFFRIRTLLIFLLIVVAVAATLLIYGYFHAKGTLPPGAATSSSGIKCMESAEYFVIDNNPGAPGLNVTAKHKTSADQTFPCADVVASSDVVVQNDLPEYVLGVTQHFLVIDSGTAPPPRGLVIYDLDTQTSTFNDTYSSPIDIATDTVTYWESTKQAPTKNNCPNLSQFTADGLGAVIESDVVLNLPALTVKPLGEYRCEPTQ